MKIENKVIYVVATGCRRSRDIYKFVNRLEELGAKVYLFATDECKKLVNFESKEYKSINLRLDNNVNKLMEIEEEDLVLVAPCSFNTMNKITHGIADSYPLTIIQTAIGKGKKVIISASMNINLWNHFATQNSIKVLENTKNITFIWPEIFIENGEEKTTMVSWDKIEDTILSQMHVLPYNPEKIRDENSFNKVNNKDYIDLQVAGKLCKDNYLCLNKSGCIAKKVKEGILISATGASVGDLQLEDMVVIHDKQGDKIFYSGKQAPSSESIIAYELLKDKPVGTYMLHCHCQRITYAEKSIPFTTKQYFMSRNTEQVEEVKNLINTHGWANLYLHGQIFIGDSIEYIIGNILKKYYD